MADAAQLRTLVAYNQWANEKILKAIDGMTADELARPVDAYFGSLTKNLQHVLLATRIWLARWKGEASPKLDDPITGPWRDAYALTHEDFRTFVERLTDADADRVVHTATPGASRSRWRSDSSSRTWSITGPITAPKRGCCSSGSGARPATWTTSITACRSNHLAVDTGDSR